MVGCAHESLGRALVHFVYIDSVGSWMCRFASIGRGEKCVAPENEENRKQNESHALTMN